MHCPDGRRASDEWIVGKDERRREIAVAEVRGHSVDHHPHLIDVAGVRGNGRVAEGRSGCRAADQDETGAGVAPDLEAGRLTCGRDEPNPPKFRLGCVARSHAIRSTARASSRCSSAPQARGATKPRATSATAASWAAPRSDPRSAAWSGRWRRDRAAVALADHFCPTTLTLSTCRDSFDRASFYAISRRINAKTTSLDRYFETRLDEHLGSLPIPLTKSNPTPRTEIDSKIRRECYWDRSDKRHTIDSRHSTSLKIKLRLLIKATVYDYGDRPVARDLVAVPEDRTAPLHLRIYLRSVKNFRMYSVAPGAKRYCVTTLSEPCCISLLTSTSFAS